MTAPIDEWYARKMLGSSSTSDLPGVEGHGTEMNRSRQSEKADNNLHDHGTINILVTMNLALKRM